MPLRCSRLKAHEESREQEPASFFTNSYLSSKKEGSPASILSISQLSYRISLCMPPRDSLET